jgi:hypothetical protein
MSKASSSKASVRSEYRLIRERLGPIRAVALRRLLGVGGVGDAVRPRALGQLVG